MCVALAGRVFLCKGIVFVFPTAGCLFSLARMEELTKERSQEWLVWNSAGDMYARACRYQEAVACYEKCMEVQEAPRYTDAAMAIAQIGEITGDTALSAKAWKTYVRILKEDWGITEGVQVEQAVKKLREF